VTTGQESIPIENYCGFKYVRLVGEGEKVRIVSTPEEFPGWEKAKGKEMMMASFVWFVNKTWKEHGW